jgi:hypothetical protein
MSGGGKSRARRAEWRDREGQVVSTAWAECVCESPRNSRDFAARSADGRFETVLPCRECLPCRKYQQLVLKRRLLAWDELKEGRLWLIEVSAPEHRTAVDCSAVSRIAVSFGSFGMCRFGMTGIAIIVAAEPRALLASLRRIGSLATAREIQRSRLGRGVSRLTRGMLVARSEVRRGRGAAASSASAPRRGALCGARNTRRSERGCWCTTASARWT